MLRSKVNLTNAIKETFINKSRTNIPLAIMRAIYRKVFRRIPPTTVVVNGSGVPLVYYRDLGFQRNPVIVCNYAFKYYQEGKKDLFMNCIKWLIKSLSRKDDDLFVWEYYFPWKRYGLKPPWISGLAQGLGIKALTLAYKETGNEKLIKLALNLFANHCNGQFVV